VGVVSLAETPCVSASSIPKVAGSWEVGCGGVGVWGCGGGASTEPKDRAVWGSEQLSAFSLRGSPRCALTLIINVRAPPLRTRSRSLLTLY